ncbi:MAG TPA: hypothetical protein VK826_15795 [Bacteroidia bacterium]|nr:hypothetical protein [Bacteroidia bacterium]
MNLDSNLDSALRFLYSYGAKGASYDWYDHRAKERNYDQWLFQYLDTLGIPENLHSPIITELARCGLIEVLPVDTKETALPPTQIKISFSGIQKIKMETEKTLEFRILRYLEPRQNEFGVTTEMIVDSLKGTFSPYEIESELEKMTVLKILGKKDQPPFGWSFADRGDRINVLQTRIDQRKNEVSEINSPQITQNIFHAPVGTFVQESQLRDIKNKQIMDGAPKEVVENGTISLLKKYWWLLVVPIIAGLMVLLVDKNT